jgi:hypothetical protein
MAIGTAAAIGLGVAGVGSVLSSSSNRRAANRAADISAENNAANVALQRDIYGQNRAIMSPFVNRGNQAGDAINALLGLGGSQQMGGPAFVGPNALSQFTPAGGAGAPYGLGDSPGFAFGDTAFSPNMTGGVGELNNSNMAQIMRSIFSQDPRIAGNAPQGTMEPTLTTGGPTVPPMTAQQAQEDAFERFRNSTGYQFRVQEAQNALNSGFAGSGLLQSGAALRGLDELRQNMASAEFGNYAALLGQQQAVGAGSASSLAGVGQNFASNVAQLNTLNANNQANAAIARAQNNPFANLFGTVGGGMFAYGMGQ